MPYPPYKGLKDSEIRDIGNKVIQEMHKWGMKIAGMFYDVISMLISKKKIIV